MKQMKYMGRQGDVLLVNESYKGLREATRKRLFDVKYKKKVDFSIEKRLPLMYGEASDHCHGIYNAESADVWFNNKVTDVQKLITVAAGSTATVQHEEHAAITIPEGNTVQLGQFEWRLEKAVRAPD